MRQSKTVFALIFSALIMTLTVASPALAQLDIPNAPTIIQSKAQSTTETALKAPKKKHHRHVKFTPATASWYGPGLYGNPLGCGGTFEPSDTGVAHKQLPCGTKLRMCYHGQCSNTSVTDRGPFIRGRVFDLQAGLRQKLGFPNGVGTVHWRVLRK